jgi:hypothetical protein
MNYCILKFKNYEFKVEEEGFTNSGMFKNKNKTLFLNRLLAFNYYIENDLKNINNCEDEKYKIHLIKKYLSKLFSIWKLFNNFSFFKIIKKDVNIDVDYDELYNWLQASFASNNIKEYNLALLTLLKKWNIEQK